MILAGLAWTVEGPGYFDAYYYYHVAVNLAVGRGFVEDVIWTYLTDPPGLPQPSNLYWMPLPSIVAAPWLALVGETFRAAQVPLVALAAAVPALTAAIGRRVLGGTVKPVVAGALVLFSGYYFVYWVAIDGFALFALAAAVASLATAELLREKVAGTRLIGAGALLGAGTAAAHLTRADGPLLLAAGALTLALCAGRARRRRQALAIGLAVLTYALVMLPWFLRNLAVAGTPLPSGGLQTVFLREYADLFSYGQTLDPAWYLGQGLPRILAGKAKAAVLNLAVLFGLEYWLIPGALVGWWTLRRDRLFQPPLVYAALLYATMTLVFTLPSGHGSMVHSSVALLPWLAIAAVRGIERIVGWIAGRLPHWNAPVATRNFSLMFVAFSALASLHLARSLIPTWQSQAEEYARLAPAVFAADANAVPLVLNPPGWWYAARGFTTPGSATAGRAIQTPSNGPEAAFAAATRYGATHLILEPGHTPAWRSFGSGESSDPRFELVAERGAYRIYRLHLPRSTE